MGSMGLARKSTSRAGLKVMRIKTWLRWQGIALRSRLRDDLLPYVNRCLNDGGYHTRMDLSGLYPPVPTFFTANGALDLDSLRSTLVRLQAEPLRGFVLGGSNGEFTSLTIEERLNVVSTARAVVAPDRWLIAGSGLESTMATIELTRAVAAAGADAALVVTPGYFKSRMTVAALVAHFIAVADASPIPVILYSVPANTGVDLPAEAVATLSRHANIIGLKDSGGDITKFGRMALECEPGFQLLAGSAGFLLPALVVGGCGGIMALANIAARPLRSIVDLVAAGDVAAARAVQLRLIPANTAVTARFGVAGLKAALEWMGHVGGAPRPPLLPLSADEQQELRGILIRAELLAS